MSAKTRNILVAVAWPYANGEPHVGHLAGAVLPADIFARFQRLRGHSVAMVSGTDMHGTPTALLAFDSKREPLDVAMEYHEIWAECLEKMLFQYDLYTHTHTETHRAATQDIFLKLYEAGYIYEKTEEQPYSEAEGLFLPDRLVTGTCPYCKSPNARGDQCDACGKTLDPSDLIDIRSKRDGTKPIFKATKHLFLKLTAFGADLEKWIDTKADDWRKNTYKQTLSILASLQDRAVTRDLAWGVPVPVAGYEEKCIYVWFEAVIGYLSATMQWASEAGDKDGWRRFWQGEAESYYFQGKDNIPFHAVIWPAMLLGYGELNLPTEVVANEFLNLGEKVSKSQGNAIWVSDYLKKYPPEALRYYLAANMPETSDSDFTWEGFIAANNNELVAAYGNLVNRTFNIAHRNFGGKAPDAGTPDAADKALIKEAEAMLDEAREALEGKRFRRALSAAMALARKTNQYLDQKQPWATVKTDPEAAGAAIATALQAISALHVAFAPFLPASSAKLRTMLGLAGDLTAAGWQLAPIPAGQQLGEPEILFQKLDSV